MRNQDRRRFLKLAMRSAGAAATFSVFPPSIRRALALPAANASGTLADVQHVVILMQENRSFDHYFGALRSVCGFGDRHPVPLATGKPVWYQSGGEREIPPFHLDTRNTKRSARFGGYVTGGAKLRNGIELFESRCERIREAPDRPWFELGTYLNRPTLTLHFRVVALCCSEP